MKGCFIMFLVLCLCRVDSLGQNSIGAKKAIASAISDTLAQKDSIGALHFSEAAAMELKDVNPDFAFCTNMLINAANINFLKTKNFQKAQEFYHQALEVSHQCKTRSC